MSLYTRGRARRSLIDTVAYRAMSQMATILGYVVMVRGMTKEDFGVFNLLYAFIPVVSTIASLGLEQTLRRYQPEYLRAGNTAGAAWLVRFVASARFGTNVILLSVILLGWNYVAPLFKLEPYRAEFMIFCLLVLLHFQARILQLSLAAHMLQRYSVGSMAVRRDGQADRVLPALVAGCLHAGQRHPRGHSGIRRRLRLHVPGLSQALRAGRTGRRVPARSSRTTPIAALRGVQ